MESLRNSKAPRYSVAQWEAQKANVERLYIDQDKPLKEVIQILFQEFGFQASEKQLKSRLPKWGFDVKNLKGDTMKHLARVKAKRKLENKESSFRVSKKPVDDQKIERYLRRHDITDEDLLAMASPVDAPSPGYSVFTPRSIRSPTPEFSLNAILMQSPSSRLDFQGLSIKESRPISPLASPRIDLFSQRLQTANTQQLGESAQTPLTKLPLQQSQLSLDYLYANMREPQKPENYVRAVRQQVERSSTDPTTLERISLMDLDPASPKEYFFSNHHGNLDVPDTPPYKKPTTRLVEAFPREDFSNFMSRDPRRYDLDDEDILSNMGLAPVTIVSGDSRYYDFEDEDTAMSVDREDPQSIMTLDLPSINTTMRVEARPHYPTASHSIRTRTPPPTPTIWTAHEISLRAYSITQFHGNVLGRYLAKTMERAKSRGRDTDQGPMARQIWFCKSCNNYYASNVPKCHMSGHVDVCYICDLVLDADPNIDTKPLCFMCEFVKKIQEDGPAYDSESSESCVEPL